MEFTISAGVWNSCQRLEVTVSSCETDAERIQGAPITICQGKGTVTCNGKLFIKMEVVVLAFSERPLLPKLIMPALELDCMDTPPHDKRREG